MPDRRRQIELLLSSRFDFTYQPETFTGKVVRRATTAGKGGTPSHWQTCPSCDNGTRRDRFGKLQPCEECKGVGKRRIDDYTGEVVATDEARDVPLAELIRRDTKHVKCPDCQDLSGNATGVIRRAPCRRCSGTGQAPVAGSWLSEPANPDQTSGDPLDAMLNAIERHNHAGSYRELDRALAGIAHHANKPLRFVALTANATQALRLLDDIYLHGDTDLTPFEDALHELALAYIDTRMPDPIVVPRDIVRNAKERRDRRTRARGKGAPLKVRDSEIRRLARQGKPPQWIAAEYGLSVSSVYQIVNGREEHAA